jgi:hypothetical protein
MAIGRTSWFETREAALLTMRNGPFGIPIALIPEGLADTVPRDLTGGKT